jgi:hypothetical protein
MSVYRQARSSVARWKEILIPTYNELIKLGVGDVWVYGSQAMSLYMKRPLGSKDLDLLATGLTMDIVQGLLQNLTPFSGQRNPYFNYQQFEHEGKADPVFSIYLNVQNEKPFAIELFQTYNGYDVRELTPYATIVKRWKNEFLTLSIEAIIGTRLGFRQPEGISAFNAQRLNLFIKTVREQVEWTKVDEFARKFELEGKIRANLKALKGHGINILDSNKLPFLV